MHQPAISVHESAVLLSILMCLCCRVKCLPCGIMATAEAGSLSQSPTLKAILGMDPPKLISSTRYSNSWYEETQYQDKVYVNQYNSGLMTAVQLPWYIWARTTQWKDTFSWANALVITTHFLDQKKKIPCISLEASQGIDQHFYLKCRRNHSFPQTALAFSFMHSFVQAWAGQALILTP